MITTVLELQREGTPSESSSVSYGYSNSINHCATQFIVWRWTNERTRRLAGDPRWLQAHQQRACSL